MIKGLVAVGLSGTRDCPNKCSSSGKTVKVFLLTLTLAVAFSHCKWSGKMEENIVNMAKTARTPANQRFRI